MSCYADNAASQVYFDSLETRFDRLERRVSDLETQERVRKAYQSGYESTAGMFANWAVLFACFMWGIVIVENVYGIGVKQQWW